MFSSDRVVREQRQRPRVTPNATPRGRVTLTYLLMLWRRIARIWLSSGWARSCRSCPGVVSTFSFASDWPAAATWKNWKLEISCEHTDSRLLTSAVVYAPQTCGWGVFATTLSNAADVTRVGARDRAADTRLPQHDRTDRTRVNTTGRTLASPRDFIVALLFPTMPEKPIITTRGLWNGIRPCSDCIWSCPVCATTVAEVFFPPFPMRKQTRARETETEHTV